jgi:hypothetical protein
MTTSSEWTPRTDAEREASIATDTLATLLEWSERYPSSGVSLPGWRVAQGRDIKAAVYSLQDKIANQTRWLVESKQREVEALDALKEMTESRDEWEQIANEYKAKLPRPTPRPTRLREVHINGWLYRCRDGVLEFYNSGWKSVPMVSPSDVLPLAALMQSPEEPAPDAVVEAIREWCAIADTDDDVERLATTVRAIVRAEIAQEGAK